MNTTDHSKRELVISAEKANLLSIVLVLPTLLIAVIPYYLLWGEEVSYDATKALVNENLWLVLIIIVIGTFIHELIHAAFFASYCKHGFSSVKIGFSKSSLTPYCHCKEALRVGQYRIGCIMPAILLGAVPVLIAITTGNVFLLITGIFFTIGASGDFLILWILRNKYSDDLVQDHPSKIGCYIYQR